MNPKDPYRGRTGRAVVNEVSVRRMRFLHSYKGVPAEILAQEYGLGLDACRRILHWKSWRHVSEVGPGCSEAEMLEAGAFQAKSVSRSEQEAVAESQKRLFGMLAGKEPSGAGLAKLEAETEKFKRGDKLVDDLLDAGPKSA